MKNFLCIVMILSADVLWAQEKYIDLVWSDEFNNENAPDPANWGYDLGHGQDGWGNHEVQSYTNNPENVRVENGHLVIHARKDESGQWTSARVKSQGKQSFTYGRIVWRAKLPPGSGTWSALWLLGENITSAGWPASGEIDVMEHVGKWPGQILAAIHTPSSFGNTVNKATTQVDDFHTTFHTYELLWTPEKLAFYVDGENFYTYAPTTRTSATWPFDKPAFLIMNVAMGGGLGSDPQYETGGLRNGIDPALTQAKMEVDYVRVYQAFEELKLEGPSIVRKNETGLTFSTNNVAGATYEWTVPAGAVIVSGQGTAKAEVDWGDTEGNVKVTMTLDGERYEKEIAVTHVVKPQGSVFPLHAPDFQIRWADRDPVNTYEVSEQEGSLRIDYQVTTPSTVPSLEGTLHRAVDLTDHPVLEVRARSFNKSRTLLLRADLVDAHGNSTNQSPVFNFSPLIDDGAFYNYRFDFGEINHWQGTGGAVDRTRITGINIFVDFGVFGAAGNDSLWIESIHAVQRGHAFTPNRPSHLSGELEGESVVLLWQDNSEGENKFSLYTAASEDGPWSHAGVADANTTSMTFTPSDGDVFKTFFKVTAQFDGGETESSNVFKLKQTITSVERDEITSVSVFPNPCQDGRVTLRLPAPGTVVRILDPAGIEHLIVRSPSPQLELELHHLPAGLYFILISHPPLRITRKLLLL